jgi:hypothetical protein
MKVIRDTHSFFQEKSLKIESNWVILPHALIQAVSDLDLL